MPRLTPEQIMLKIGINPEAPGEHIPKVRKYIADSGMENMGISWGEDAFDKYTDDDRARFFLEVEHAMQYVVLVDKIEPEWYDFKNHVIMFYRNSVAKFRRFYDEKILGKKNPYSNSK